MREKRKEVKVGSGDSAAKWKIEELELVNVLRIFKSEHFERRI